MPMAAPPAPRNRNTSSFSGRPATTTSSSMADVRKGECHEGFMMMAEGAAAGVCVWW